MSIRAHRSSTRLAILAVVGLLAGAAQAQDARPGAGPRYMSWSGRPLTTIPAGAVADQAPAQGAAPVRTGMIPRRVAPSRAVSTPAMQAPVAPRPVARGLTPAGAWLDPQPATPFMAGSPDPLAYARPAPAPVTGPVARPVSQAPILPAASVVAAADTMAEVAPPRMMAAADPMAPRPDAPIFRLRPQGQASAPAGTVAAGPDLAGPNLAGPVPARPGQQGSRYYSVHRETGHAPDRTPLPEAVFYDSVALDLAEPPEPALPQRDAQGRLRAPVRDEDPDRP